MDWTQAFAGRATRMKASEIRELLKLLDQPDIISFAGGIPDPALFPRAEFAAAYDAVLSGAQGQAALQYSVSEGYGPLRDWLAGYMAGLGVPCTADNILITSGSQQALDFLGKMLLDAGDIALVGWPTYMGALGAFNAYEPEYRRLDPNSNQAFGADDGTPRFAYASVDFANPTGRTMPLSERQALLAQADALNIPIIEDAAYQALRFEGEPVPPILALDIARNAGDIEATRTIYCGSFSKTMAPGLRVGWVCAAKPLIQRLVLVKQATDLHSSTLNQMALNAVVRDIFDAHVAKLRAAYKTRRDAMLSALEAHMPEGVTWLRPEGGMFVWITLPKEFDGAELLARSLETERVAFVPGRAFFADGSNGNTIRLAYTCMTPEQITEGIQRLARLIAA